MRLVWALASVFCLIKMSCYYNHGDSFGLAMYTAGLIGSFLLFLVDND